jgi:hypothetical protein
MHLGLQVVHSQSVDMFPPDVLKAVGPLRLIFWGGLICVFDVKVNGFDFLNDFIGAGLVAWGVLALSGIHVHARYRSRMNFVSVVAVLSMLEAFLAHFPIPSDPVNFVFAVLGLIAMISTVLFCVAMRWFCEEAQLDGCIESWRTTTVLFILIYCVPLGLFYFAVAIAILLQESFSIKLGAAGLLLIPVFFLPLIHLFISTSRMRQAAAQQH